MPPTTRPVRVLCVDDNRDMADTTAMLLRMYGCETAACYDGPTALEEYQPFRPDVALVDLNMPGMNGDELARRLREQAGRRRVVVACVSAMGKADPVHPVDWAAFDFHLVKPPDPGGLVELVRAAAARAAKRPAAG